MDNKSYQKIIDSIDLNNYNNYKYENLTQEIWSYKCHLDSVEESIEKNDSKDAFEFMFLLSVVFNNYDYGLSNDDHQKLRDNIYTYLNNENTDNFLLIENIYDYDKDDDEDLDDYNYDKKRFDCIKILLEKREIIDYYYDNKCQLFNFIIDRMKLYVCDYCQKYYLTIPDSIIYNMFILFFSHVEEESIISYNLNHLYFHLPLKEMVYDPKYKELKKLEKMNKFYQYLENSDHRPEFINIFSPIESNTKSAHKSSIHKC